MIRTVSKFDLHGLHLESGKNTVHHSSAESFFYSWNEFAGNITACNFILKLQSAIFSIRNKISINRRNGKFNISKFTTAACLFLIYFTVFNSSVDRFLIINLRSSLVDLHFKLTLQTVNNDLKVKFTH